MILLAVAIVLFCARGWARRPGSRQKTAELKKFQELRDGTASA